MSGATVAAMIGSSFVPVTRTYGYTNGSSITETVPAGASHVVITVDGGGGAGAFSTSTSGQGAGGGGSGRAVLTIAVGGGNALSYVVGIGGALGGSFNQTPLPGNDSIVSGTVLGGSVNMTGGGGGAASGLGTSSTPGAGGTARQGSINTPGHIGGTSVSLGGTGLGGNAGSGALGGQLLGEDGFSPGGGGAASPKPTPGITSGFGSNGQVMFAYS